MSRVMTFSRLFPKGHHRAGKPTYFVEKIWNSIGFENAIESKFDEIHSLTGYDADFIQRFFDTLGYTDGVKHHTIRAGHRWKVGDWFSPRVWGNDINPKSGRSGPYHSKQITFAPDIQIKKVWEFDVDPWDAYVVNRKPLSLSELKTVALNDGFENLDDFEMYLNVKPKDLFQGQIICWNENINY